ncbi:MAG: class I SAM-dependent methyltransferase [Promethearchaeota archaeon]|jgi:tRNA wybutosine-synthesizing protein 2
MAFKKKLAEKLDGVLTADELSILPGGFQTLGNIIIVKLNSELSDKNKIIGEAYLDLLPKMRSVYINKGRVVGSYREPENIEFLAGEDNPIVEHKEHGIKYRFNITKIMFSQGNLRERRFLATLVKKGEIVVDMFAGMGYFSLPIAKHSEVVQIYSIELNPTSYKTLLENIKINHLEDKIIAINGDCKKEVLKLSSSGIRADRVIMGVFPAPKDYVKEALSLTQEEGTMFHYEGVVEKDTYISLFEEFAEIGQEEQYICDLKSHRFVKSYGPNLFHTVLDIFVRKN